MLSKEETKVIHPIWGEIRLNEKFSKVLEIREFRNLAMKSQLGTKTLSKQMLNAKHSRLLHSIGVMRLTEMLLDVCEKKFSQYFVIENEEKEILLLAALGHDIGHSAFSHSLEDRTLKTHEERTIEFFEKNAQLVNEIFGYDISSEVIKIFKDNIEIKKNGSNCEMGDKLDILFIFTSLLIGTIDCDRLEYIVTDRFMVTGEKSNFLDIFNYITIVLLNDSPTVGFEKGAIPIIENLLISRFNQYEQIYYDEDSIIIEMAMKEFISLEHWSEELVTKLSEADILSKLNSIILDENQKGTIKERLARIIIDGERENLMMKKFTDKKEMNYFLRKLDSITSNKVYKISKKKVQIYDPDKNKVYIKDDDGVVKDIRDLSLKIKDFSLEFYYVIVDLDKCYEIENESKIRELFEDNPVEVEKKFILFKDLNGSESNMFAEVKNLLECNVTNVKFGEWNIIKNVDVYFKSLTPLPEGTVMRVRKSEDNTYYIKIPTHDGTCITKREEHRFTCNDVNEFLKLAKELFELKGCSCTDGVKIEEEIEIETTRYKTLVTMYNSQIEIACDFSNYRDNKRTAKGMMLECELKKGDDLALWYLTGFIKKAGFTETNKSKRDIAKKLLN